MGKRDQCEEDTFKAALERLTSGHDLSREQARALFGALMRGEPAEAAVGGLLMALRTKGESVDELVGAAEAMRACVIPIRCERPCVDTCGTGGDGMSTFNVSTTAAVIAAGAGAVVAKHGNRSTTRASGSTEVLTELGIDVEADQQTVERCLAEVGIGYLNARLLHPAMRFVAPVREALGVRTIFNLLGPLTNPAGAKRQVLGVPSLELMDKMARALVELGAEHAWVVHGHDGLCDLTITGATSVIEVRNGERTRFSVMPEDVGLLRASPTDLFIDGPAASAAIVRRILDGERGTPRDHAVMNAGAALVVAGVASDFPDGVARAGLAIDSGCAADTFRQWHAIAGASDGESS